MKRCVLILCAIVSIAGCTIYTNGQQPKNVNNPESTTTAGVGAGEETQPPGSNRSEPVFAGTTIKARELRKGKHSITIPPEKRREVDLNSIVTVIFSRSVSDPSATKNRFVKTFMQIRQRAERLQADRARINAIQLDESLSKDNRKTKIDEIKEAASDLNNKVIKLVKETIRLNTEDDSEFLDIIESGYPGIISWATNKIEESLHKVGVEALLYQPGTTVQPLAIRGYNNLAEGELRADTPLIGVSKEDLQRVADELRRIRAAAKTDTESNPKSDANAPAVAPDDNEESDKEADAAGKALQRVNHLLSLDIVEGSPARIDLSRTSAQEGDHVDVIVSFYKKEKTSSAGEADKRDVKAVKTITYPLEIVRAGLNHRTAVDVIFARADRSKNGDSERKDWKLNAAASVNWFRHYANPENDKEWLLNWLRPGLGVHLAGLDMSDDESLEFGIGPSFSLWGGFLVGGLGWNLSEDSDRTYYYVGVDLMHVLTEAQGLGK